MFPPGMAEHDLPDQNAQHGARRYGNHQGSTAQRETLYLAESLARAKHGFAPASLSQKAEHVLKHEVLRLIIVFRAQVFDLGLRQA